MKLNFGDQDIMDHIDEGLIVVDSEGRVVFVNQAYTKILGVPLHKVMGRYIQQVEPGATLIEVLTTRKPIIRDKNYIKNLDKYVSVKIYPIFKGTVFCGAYSIFKDVTELKRLNYEVLRATNVAEEYERQIEMQNELNNQEIVGSSPAFITIVKQVLSVAKTDATVLIRGENGVGKEIFAKLLHKNSSRKNKPLITINCAAIPDTLIESELFGYVEGSFTGAKKGGSVGKFQLADGGTLFLDEIGDMPLQMQSKLLRVIQEGEITKIGSDKLIPVDVRLVAATNQPLEAMIGKGLFRKDLFYRLNVISFDIPPLRSRKHDIVLLADHFLAKYNKKYGKTVSISPAGYQMLEHYNWPGNVRELQNCMERTVILNAFAPDLPLREMLPEAPGLPEVHAPLTLHEGVKEVEHHILCEGLAQAQGNRQKAMELLGLSRRTFYRKLKEHHIPLLEPATPL
jgi:PAS domain S-box-containing protein